MTDSPALHLPTREELDALFNEKYERTPDLGTGPAARLKFDYFSPDDHYEALVSQLVTEQTRWLDVGCGRDSFPSNRNLAATLANRCARLVGVDPDETTLNENPFVHEKVHANMNDYRSDEKFDLVTLRMVAEHVEHPPTLLEAIAHCTEAGSLVVIYTVNSRSPVPLVTRIVPFRFHNPVKRVLWGTDEKDTFPTCFNMNRRPHLARIFSAAGFDEVLFDYLDDCRTFQSFAPLLYAELTLRTAFHKLDLNYPENCLMGVYRKS